MRPSHTWSEDLVSLFFKLKVVHEFTAYNGAIYISDVGSQINHITHSGYLGSSCFLPAKATDTPQKSLARLRHPSCQASSPWEEICRDLTFFVVRVNFGQLG